MWPGRGAPAREDRVGPRVDDVPAGRRGAPGRGCPAARGRGRPRRAASSSGTRQSTPTTSAPASPMSASSSPVPTPKWMRGTPGRPTRRAEHRGGVRQHERAVVGGGQRARPRSRRAGRRAAPGRDLHPQERRPVIRASRSQQVASTASGSPYISALVRAWSLLRAALDEVARQGERRTGEADERGRSPSSATSSRTASVT